MGGRDEAAAVVVVVGGSTIECWGIVGGRSRRLEACSGMKGKEGGREETMMS